MRVVAKNPVAAVEWGLIVAVLLVLGSIPFFLGLTVIMPVLGHATWHLYRKAIESPLTSSAHEVPETGLLSSVTSRRPLRARAASASVG
jgi:uncharacterized membrane protein